MLDFVFLGNPAHRISLSSGQCDCKGLLFSIAIVIIALKNVGMPLKPELIVFKTCPVFHSFALGVL